MNPVLKEKFVEGQGKIKVLRSQYVIIKGKRYLKTDDTKVCRLYSPKTERLKYYLKDSFLVQKTWNGEYALKSSCVFCSDINGYAVLADNRNPINGLKDYPVKLGNKYYLNSNIVSVNRKRYFVGDSTVCFDSISKSHQLKKDCVRLHPSLYGENKFTLSAGINSRPIVQIKDSEYWARESDTFRIIDEKGVIGFYERGRRRDSDLVPAFVGFVSDSVISFDNGHVKNGYTFTKFTGENFTCHDDTNRWVHNSQYKQYCDHYSSWYEMRVKPNIVKAIKYANQSYSDLDPSENQPTKMNFNRELKPSMGGNIGYDGRKPFMVSSSFAETGGQAYTFGVEIETSNGFLTDHELAKVGLCSMGDNSILGNEYITQALHGDVGAKILKDQAAMVNSRCVVDDTCSIHVHVGGWDHKKVITPNFGVRFAVNSISLGCQIEEDLFKTQPPSRSPWKKHCHTITKSGGDYSGDYSKISMDNYKALLGSYVFGRQIDKDINSMATVSRWATPRYKWLNLRNAVSQTNIKTIELRIFAPTTVYDKIMQAVRIAMAFTWFIENQERRILEGGVSLEEVITTAYKNKSRVRDEVLEYIRYRTKRFNRTNIYSRR
jgi:hypothetical protein